MSLTASSIKKLFYLASKGSLRLPIQYWENIREAFIPDESIFEALFYLNIYLINLLNNFKRGALTNCYLYRKLAYYAWAAHAIRTVIKEIKGFPGPVGQSEAPVYFSDIFSR